MSALDPDDAVSTFRSCLSSFARRNYEGGQLSTAHLHAAVRQGWTPQRLAKECSESLPTAQAWKVIQKRLEHCARNPPKAPQSAAEKAAKTVRKPHCGQCYSDDYRWECDAEDRPVRPCPRCSNAVTVNEKRTA